MAISDTEVAATVQELVVSVVQETLKQNSVLVGTCSDYSQYVGPGQDVAKIPRRNQFAAADKTEDTDLIVQEMSFSTDDLALSKHKAIYAELELKGAMQSNVAVQAEIIKEQAAELALQVDKDIITELKLVSTAAPDHLLDYSNTPTDTLLQTDILEARKLLNIQKVPQMDRCMVISPAQEKAMLEISAFVEAEKYGTAEGLRNGELGRIYGFTVLMHTELADAEALFYHKSHVGYATQMTPDFRTDIDLKGVKEEFLLHQIYGTKVLDSGVRGVFFNGTGV